MVSFVTILIILYSGKSGKWADKMSTLLKNNIFRSKGLAKYGSAVRPYGWFIWSDLDLDCDLENPTGRYLKWARHLRHIFLQIPLLKTHLKISLLIYYIEEGFWGAGFLKNPLKKPLLLEVFKLWIFQEKLQMRSFLTYTQPPTRSLQKNFLAGKFHKIRNT